jgi:hypothetical protein
MKKYGATLTFDERMRGLDLEQMTDALLDGVDDPGGLFGGMVAWAKAHGDATDPIRAVDALSDVMIVEAAERAAGIPISSEAELEAAAPMILRGPPGMARTLARIATDGELRSVDSATTTLWRTKPDRSDETWTLELSETAGRWHITDD